jgi:hypothetical protein
MLDLTRIYGNCELTNAEILSYAQNCKKHRKLQNPPYITTNGSTACCRSCLPQQCLSTQPFPLLLLLVSNLESFSVLFNFMKPSYGWVESLSTLLLTSILANLSLFVLCRYPSHLSSAFTTLIMSASSCSCYKSWLHLF